MDSHRASSVCRLILLALVVGALFAPGGTSRGPALAAAPKLTLTPTSVTPGRTVFARGMSFLKDADGQLVWDANGAVLVEFRTNRSGAFLAKFVVPNVPNGTYGVSARMVVGSASLESTIATAVLAVLGSTAATATPAPTRAIGTATPTPPTATVAATPLPPTATSSPTPILPTATGTSTPLSPTATPSPSATSTRTPIPTRTATATRTPTPTRTPTAPATAAATSTATATATATRTATATATPTRTPTATATATRTPMPTATNTQTATPTTTPTRTPTYTPSPTPVRTPQLTFSPASAAPGTSVLASLSGYGPNETVALIWYGWDASYHYVTSTVVGPNGSGGVSFAAPATPHDGTFTFEGKGQTSYAYGSFTVVGTQPTATPTNTPTATPTVAPTGTFYVATTGNDNNPGTAALPFRTIQRGLDVAQPGNTVVVRPGTYAGANFLRSGTAAAPITLRAEFPATEAAPSTRSILQGTGSGDGLRIASRTYLVIDGFEITNFAVGIRPSGATSNLLIRRNILRSNLDVGVQCASCSNSRIEGNAFLDPGPAYPAPAVQDYGVNFYGGSGNSVVGNYFFGKHNQALSLKHSVGQTYIADNTFEGCMFTCVYLGQNDDNFGGTGDLTSYGVTVEHNVFRDAVDAGTGAYYQLSNPIVVRNVQDATVRANFIENSFGSAIRVLRCAESCAAYGLSPTGAAISGNVIANAKGSWPAFEVVDRGYGGDVITIANNTVYNASKAFGLTGSLAGLAIRSNNLINTGSSPVSGSAPAAAFAYNNWYVLSSPAIDTRQSATDTHLDPQLAGPLSVYDPYAAAGPRLADSADFTRASAFQPSATSPLADVGASFGSF